MRIESNENGIKWITEKKIVNEKGEIDSDKLNFFFSAIMSVDCGKKTGLARLLVNTIEPDPESLFWVTEHGVWASCENFDLFDGYRKYLNEERSLREAPCHFFDKHDLNSIQSLFGMALYFFWDAWLVQGDGGLIIKVDHDEGLSIFAKDNELFLRLKNEVLPNYIQEK